MDRGAWWAIVHGVEKESDMTEHVHTHTHTHTHTHMRIKSIFTKQLEMQVHGIP